MMEEGLLSVHTLTKIKTEDEMMTFPFNNQDETSQDFMNTYLKAENDNYFRLKAEVIQSDIYLTLPQGKLKSDQDVIWSQCDFKDEIQDFGLQIKTEEFDHVPTGLIPPIEMDEEFESARNTHALDKTLNKSSRGNKRNKTRKSSTEKSDALSQEIGWSAEQTENPDLSKGKTCFIPEKTRKGKKSNKLHKEKIFRCETCGKEFHQSALLTDHVKIHRRQKPYACDKCEMKFAKPSYLKVHLRRHAGERTFSCDCCEKTFFDMYDLRVHQRDHTGERPYSCSECGKGFKRVYTLNKHKRTHSDEKPFQCSVCGKAYKYGYSYRLHMKEHLD